MAGDADDDSNPFLHHRRKLEQDAEVLEKKLAKEAEVLEKKLVAEKEKEQLRLQKELQEHLDQAKNILLEDIDNSLSEIPPLLIKKTGSTSFDSEAFAWFYEEDKPLLQVQILASGSQDKTIRLWNANTGKYLRTLEGHRGEVNAVAFSPDGKTLASSSYDETIRLWNANTGEYLRTLEGHKATIYSVAFCPEVFTNNHLNAIYSHMRHLVAEADFELSTNDGIEFTITWHGIEA
jgi:WD40 repeat protein